MPISSVKVSGTVGGQPVSGEDEVTVEDISLVVVDVVVDPPPLVDDGFPVRVEPQSALPLLPSTVYFPAGVPIITIACLPTRVTGEVPVVITVGRPGQADMKSVLVTIRPATQGFRGLWFKTVRGSNGNDITRNTVPLPDYADIPVDLCPATAVMRAVYNLPVSAPLSSPAFHHLRTNVVNLNATLQSALRNYFQRSGKVRGLEVFLSTNNKQIELPPSVTIPWGLLEVEFSVTIKAFVGVAQIHASLSSDLSDRVGGAYVRVHSI